MRIIVKYKDNIKELDVSPNNTVQNIKNIVCGQVFKIDPKSMYFIYNNYLLQDHKKIGDSVSHNNSICELVPKIKGGNATAAFMAPVMMEGMASMWSDGDVKKTERLTQIDTFMSSETDNIVSDVCNVKQSGQNIVNMENIKNCKIGGISQSNELKNTCILNQTIDILTKQNAPTELVDDVKNQSINSGQFKESDNTTDLKNIFKNDIDNNKYNDIKGKCAAAQIGNLNTVNLKNCDSSTVDSIVQSNVAFNKCVREGIINQAEDQTSKIHVKQVMDNTTAGGKGSEKAIGGLNLKKMPLIVRLIMEP